MRAPKITVFMPLYNSERYVRYAVESILQQSYVDFEFLIIDDCSTDGSAEILQSYDDPRIRIITNARHMGLTRSLNKGLRLARGEYVARIDTDDIALPARLEKQARYLDQHPAVALVATRVEIIDARGRVIRRYVPHLSAESTESMYCTLIFHDCLVHSSVMFRLQMTKILGGYDEAFDCAEDTDLWYRLSRISRIAMLDEKLTRWRDHPFSLSKVRRSEQDRAALQIYARNLVDLLQQPVDLNKYYCFHYARFGERRLEINAESLVELIKIYKKIIMTSPPFLNQDLLKRHLNFELLVYLAVLLRRNQFKDFLKISCDASFRAFFYDLARQNLLRIA